MVKIFHLTTSIWSVCLEKRTKLPSCHSVPLAAERFSRTTLKQVRTFLCVINCNDLLLYFSLYLISGTYVCANCEFELFGSESKYGHHTPWPAFHATKHQNSLSKKMQQKNTFKVRNKKAGVFLTSWNWCAHFFIWNVCHVPWRQCFIRFFVVYWKVWIVLLHFYYIVHNMFLFCLFVCFF